MADMPPYEGERVILRWGQTEWRCRVYRSNEQCGMCGGATMRFDPPWDTWSLLCLQESALTTTPIQRDAARAALPQGAVGMVSALPVHLERGEA